MGLGYMGLAASVDEIGSIFSSRDDERFAALMHSDHPFVRSLLDSAERRNALRDIFVGADCTSESEHHYGYAMEAACFQFGESLGEVGGSYGAIYDVMELLREADMDVDLLPDPDVEWFVPIPPMTSWPTVATIATKQCGDRAGALATALTRIPKDAERREFVDTFQRWYSVCAETSRDLIVIAH